MISAPTDPSRNTNAQKTTGQPVWDFALQIRDRIGPTSVMSLG